MTRPFLALATAATLLPALPATAQDLAGIGRLVDNSFRAYSVLILRSLVSFTYDSFETSWVSGETRVTGLKLSPDLPWDTERACTISVGRALFRSTIEEDAIRFVIDMAELAVPPACLEPDAAGFLSSIGYPDGVTSDSAVLDIRYVLSSSAADVALQANIPGAADLNIEANLDYFWFTGVLDEEFAPAPMPEEFTDPSLPPEEPAIPDYVDPAPAAGPRPAIRLRVAQATFENRGLWQKIEPVVIGSVGATEALPGMVRGALESELNQGGTRALSQAEDDFLSSLTAALDEFLKKQSRITVSMAPPNGVWLDEGVFASPDVAIATLRPYVTTDSHAQTSLIPPGLLKAAIANAEGVSEEEKLAAGRALMAGLGAPRDRVTGQKVLQPLADAWNSRAAMALAEGLAPVDPAAAYPFVLRALAGGEPGAIALADRLEAGLTPRAILDAQAAAIAAWPADPGLAALRSDLLANADPGAMRRTALDLSLGRGVPRSYAAAYTWASLSAAAGDRSAAQLRDELEVRAKGADWRAALDAAAAAALSAWDADGLGQKLYEKTGAN